MKTEVKIEPQVTFDTIVKHLRKQGKKAQRYPTTKEIEAGIYTKENSLVCAYRAEGGLMCAAGCLIPHSLYVAEMEDQCIDIQFSPNKVTSCIYNLGHNLALVSTMQDIHDNCNVQDWENEFRRVAQEHNLQYLAPTPVST